MSDGPIELDEHRGMSAQRNTVARRRLHEVKADQAAIRIRQDDMEKHLHLCPATTLLEVAAKAKYLIQLFAATPEAQHPRRQDLIASSLQELDRLFDDPVLKLQPES
jgi:hypothetical protein